MRHKFLGLFLLFFTTAIFAQNKHNIEWVDIPAGTFTMGSPTSEVYRSDNETQHQVTLSAFKMSKFEITVGQFRQYCIANGKSMPEPPPWGWEDDHPMCNVTWYEASDFAKWMGCRLPTEAEWEYACRAGSTTAYWFGDKIPEVYTAYLMYNWDTPKTDEQIDLFKLFLSYRILRFENNWGLIDMHGSMYEWCSDWYGNYSTSAQTNPKGASSGSYRVCRGGGWGYDASRCRAARRDRDAPDRRCRGIGFRLVSPK